MTENGYCAAISWGLHHLPGGGVEHHFLLGRRCRCLFFASGPHAGRGQDEDQRNREGPHHAYDTIHGFLHRSLFIERIAERLAAPWLRSRLQRRLP